MLFVPESPTGLREQYVGVTLGIKQHCKWDFGRPTPSQT